MPDRAVRPHPPTPSSYAPCAESNALRSRGLATRCFRKAQRVRRGAHVTARRIALGEAHVHVGRHAPTRAASFEPRANLITLEVRLVEVLDRDALLAHLRSTTLEDALRQHVRLDIEHHGDALHTRIA